MTGSDNRADSTSALVAAEIAVEQAHVDKVYTELAKASERAALVEADGLARGRTDRIGDVRDEEMTGLFERDALVFHAAAPAQRPGQRSTKGSCSAASTSTTRRSSTPTAVWSAEVRYIGRLGVRDDDYEPLVIDWRAPAASPFYRATPVEPMGVLRRRVLRCKGSDVVGIEDDLMVPEAPDDLVVVGDGALMAALTRSRGAQMRDIVATIQRHQDEAIRAPRPRGHRDHRRPRHRQDGRRPAPGGLPALLRSAPLRVRRHPRRRALRRLHGLHRARAARPSARRRSTCAPSATSSTACSTERLDTPAAAALKGSCGSAGSCRASSATPCRTRRPSSARSSPGSAVRLDAPTAATGCARSVLRQPPAQPRARTPLRQLLAEAAWRRERASGEREEFIGRVRGPPRRRRVRARSGGGSSTRARSCCGSPTRSGYAALRRGRPRRRRGARRSRRSIAGALDTGTWSVADVALVDDLAARLGAGAGEPSARSAASTRSRSSTTSRRAASPSWAAGPPRARRPAYDADPAPTLGSGCCKGGSTSPTDYAHVLVDEAQDLSPMQWRMLGRRGRCGVVDRRRRRRAGVLARPRRGAPGARGGVRRPAAPRSSTWTPTTATRARSSTTPPT